MAMGTNPVAEPVGGGLGKPDLSDSRSIYGRTMESIRKVPLTPGGVPLGPGVSQGGLLRVRGSGAAPVRD
jgi:hypothetical protein